MYFYGRDSGQAFTAPFSVTPGNDVLIPLWGPYLEAQLYWMRVRDGLPVGRSPREALPSGGATRAWGYPANSPGSTA
jgi:hypothetical protein